MNRFEALWSEALKELKPVLSESLPVEADKREFHSLLEKVHFPGALTILGTPAGGGVLGNDLLRKVAERAAKEPPLRDRGIDVDDIERILTALLIRRQHPQDVLGDENVQTLIIEQALRELADQGIAVRPEEARKVLQLLATGAFFKDVAGATAAVLYTIPKLPIALVTDVTNLNPLRLPFKIAQLTLAVGQDVIGVPVQIPSVVADLFDGSLDHSPTVMTHTLAWLYDNATVATTAKMIHTLLENETVKTALVIYARSNGIPIEPQHVDTLRNSVFHSGSPDLGPILMAGVQQLFTRYSQPRLERLLQSMVLPV